MIRINLLPLRAQKKSAAGRQWIAIIIFVLGVSGVGNWFWFHQMEVAVDAVKARIAQDKQDNKKLEDIIGQVKDLKRSKDEMKQKLAVLSKLKEGRQGPVRVMDEISQIIPQHVWLTGWEETAGSVNITGSGNSHEDVAAFMKALRESKFFDNVALKNDHIVHDDQYDFVITCTVKYTA